MAPSQFCRWLVQHTDAELSWEICDVLSSSAFQGFVSLLVCFGAHLSSSAGQSGAPLLWKCTLAIVSQGK